MPLPDRNVSGLLQGSRAGIARGRPSFSLRNRVYRAVFAVCWLLLARWTPPPLAPWRRLLLLAFGARLAASARIYASAIIWSPAQLTMSERAVLGPRVRCYNVAPVRLGAGAIVSQGAHLCTATHEIDDGGFQLVARPIDLRAGSWVAAEAFVGPGVTLGEGAVLGARGVAFAAIPPWTVWAGNPARFLRERGRADER